MNPERGNPFRGAEEISRPGPSVDVRGSALPEVFAARKRIDINEFCRETGICAAGAARVPESAGTGRAIRQPS